MSKVITNLLQMRVLEELRVERNPALLQAPFFPIGLRPNCCAPRGRLAQFVGIVCNKVVPLGFGLDFVVGLLGDCDPCREVVVTL